MPKATLAGWCRDVPLTDDQIAAMKDPAVGHDVVYHATPSADLAPRSNASARRPAFAAAHPHDPLFVAGTVLYWGEGAKTSPRRLSVTNADAAALRLFSRWVCRFHEPEPAFVLALHLHGGNDDAAANRSRTEALDPAGADFTRTFIRPAAQAIAGTSFDTECVASCFDAARTPGTRRWPGSG